MTKFARRSLLLIPVLGLVVLGAFWWASMDSEELTTLVPEVSAALDEEQPERLPQAQSLDVVGLTQEPSAREAVGEPDSELPVPAQVAPDSGASFWCRVEEAQGAMPVAGARVSFSTELGTLFDSGKKRRRVPFRARECDVKGSCELRVSGRMTGFARVDAAGFAPLFFLLSEGHGTQTEALVLRLKRGAELQVLVLDAASRPIANASVELSCGAGKLLQTERRRMFPSVEEWKARTGADGRCVLTSLPAGVALDAGAWLQGKRLHVELDPLVFESEERRSLVWRTGTGGIVRGSVHDQSGTALRGRQLWLVRAMPATPGRVYLSSLWESRVFTSTNTDEEGRFEFVDVPEGAWLVGTAPDGDRRSRSLESDEVARERVAAVGTRVTVAPGTGVHELQLVAQRGLYIEGRVLVPRDPGGLSVSVMGVGELGSIGSYAVQGEFDSAQSYAPLISDRSRLMNSEYRFRLGPLLDVEHELIARSRSMLPSESVRARPGDADVVLELVVGGALLGRVVDSTGSEMGRGTILVSGADSDYFSMTRGFPGQGFEIDGLSAGSYHLVAREPDGSIGVLRNVQLVQGERRGNLVITVAPAATLRVVRKAGTGPGSLRVSMDGALIASESIVQGASIELQVPPGELSVELRSQPESTVSQTVTCTLGQPAEIVFDSE